MNSLINCSVAEYFFKKMTKNSSTRSGYCSLSLISGYFRQLHVIFPVFFIAIQFTFNCNDHIANNKIVYNPVFIKPVSVTPQLQLLTNYTITISVTASVEHIMPNTITSGSPHGHGVDYHEQTVITASLSVALVKCVTFCG